MVRDGYYYGLAALVVALLLGWFWAPLAILPLLMGAFSMDLPTVFMPAGPMLRGDWGGVVLGSSSAARLARV